MTLPQAAARQAAGGGATVPVPAEGVWEVASPPSCSKKKLALAPTVKLEEKTNTCATAYSQMVFDKFERTT